jgi:O-acetyl-ADP-ribose deacetylase (regulator of RNase III)
MEQRLSGADAHFSLGTVDVVVSSRFAETLAERIDAIVSSDDTMLSMSGGVSQAILRRAGPRLAEEARRLVPLKVGDVGVTSAGELPARFILHAVSVDWKHGILPTERTLLQLSQEIFRRCEVLGVRRLAVPALATGAAGFTAPHVASLVVQALAEHVSNPTVLKAVVLSLPDSGVRRAFEKALELKAGRSLLQSRRSALFSRPLGDPPPASARPSRVPARLDPPWPGSRLTGPQHSRPLVNNRYVLLEELGRGGMGIVYLAWDIHLRKTFAIKVLRPDQQISTERRAALQREAATWIGLNHEGILRLHHFEPWDDTVGPYLIMEYVDWDSGDQWIASAGAQGLPATAVLRVGISLCSALAHTHTQRVLHGDIKPSNFFVDQAGTRAKLTDFGLARTLGSRQRSALLVQLAGTPDYMAPEQKSAGAQITPATDVYLAAASLCECLTGIPSLPTSGPAGAKKDRARALALATIRKGLERDPSRRPETAEEFSDLLSETLREISSSV